MKALNHLVSVLLLTLSLFLVSAISVDSISSTRFVPGSDSAISIEVENTLDHDITNVLFSLELDDVPFISLGSSSSSLDELEESEEETFVFRLRASPSSVPGDYLIPYTLSYIDDDERENQSGTIGVTIEADPELDASVNVETPVVGERTTITLRIINEGLADARFVSIDVDPNGFELLSEESVYIGSMDSDDFETATFEVKFTRETPIFLATINYRDFDNQEKSMIVDIPISLYSQEEARELGLIQTNNTVFYIVAVILVIVIFFVWRMISRRRRMRKSMRSNE